jgi:hypothetical protein
MLKKTPWKNSMSKTFYKKVEQNVEFLAVSLNDELKNTI